MMFEDYKPMLACPVDLGKVSKYSSYWMEAKLDGVRCIVIKQGSSVELYTRSGKSMTDKLQHIADQLRSIPRNFVLDGELGYLEHSLLVEGPAIPWGIDFNRTMRVIGSNPMIARAKQRQYVSEGMKPIALVVFDILCQDTDDYRMMQQHARRQMLELMFKYIGGQDNLLPDVRLSYKWSCWDLGMYENIVFLGGEGVMLKNPVAPYHIGARRANTWYKVKAFESVDCKIVDWEKGQGKYSAQLGALIVTDPQGLEINISGMTDAVRQDMTEDFTKYDGKMCEVRYFGRVGRDKTGYRHPQFLRMRPDLDT